jgi:hypothetical protein
LSSLFAFEKPLAELRAVRVVANDAAQGERFMIPQNMRVPGSSVIRSLFEADGKRDAANREDLGNWSDSKGEWRGVRWRWRPARWPTGLSPSCSRSSRCDLSGSPLFPSLFSE